MLSIEEWTREVGFEYNLQDLNVIACIDDMRKLILPRMETLERENPKKWTELGVLIYQRASSGFLKASTLKPLAYFRVDYVGQC
jgi:hypothetical protein